MLELMVGCGLMGLPLGMDLLNQWHAVFVETPYPSSRRKRRNVSYLGPIPAPQAGLNHLATLYIARCGYPAVFQSIFNVTGLPNDGWEGSDRNGLRQVVKLSAVVTCRYASSFSAGAAFPGPAPHAQFGTAPPISVPQTRNILSPRRWHTSPAPALPQTLAVAPLIADKRCYGEASVCPRGQPGVQRDWMGSW